MLQTVQTMESFFPPCSQCRVRNKIEHPLKESYGRVTQKVHQPRTAEHHLRRGIFRELLPIGYRLSILYMGDTGQFMYFYCNVHSYVHNALKYNLILWILCESTAFPLQSNWSKSGSPWCFFQLGFFFSFFSPTFLSRDVLVPSFSLWDASTLNWVDYR